MAPFRLCGSSLRLGGRYKSLRGYVGWIRLKTLLILRCVRQREALERSKARRFSGVVLYRKSSHTMMLLLVFVLLFMFHVVLRRETHALASLTRENKRTFLNTQYTDSMYGSRARTSARHGLSQTVL